MHLGSVYLIVNDFEKSIDFYEKVLQIPVTAKNMSRFAVFEFEGKCISLMNGHFDTENPDKVVHLGEYNDYFDDLKSIVFAPNTRKSVLNFWDEDLEMEYRRIKGLNISENITKIRYVCNVAPYYFFSFTDPDGNIIEVTSNYTPKENEFVE